jgi:predicted RNA-binding Zn ribbon-like protein
MVALELVRDFVNTADLEAGEDKLGDARGLQYWLLFHGLAELRDRATEAEAADARALREALRELLRAHNGLEVDREAASETLDSVARGVGLDVRFVDGAVRFVPRKAGTARGLGLLLAAVGQAMADGSWQRLKACKSDTCRWAFIDHARNRSRQWCDMAVCGNRAKARTFRSKRA